MMNDDNIPILMNDIVRAMMNHSSQQDLVHRAIAGCAKCLHEESASGMEGLDAIEIKMHSQCLVYNHATIPYPYIETHLTLMLDGREIGRYRHIALLDGTDEDDYLVLEPIQFR